MRSHFEILLIWVCAAVAVLPPLWIVARMIRRAARRRRRSSAVVSLFDIIGVPRSGERVTSR